MFTNADELLLSAEYRATDLQIENGRSLLWNLDAMAQDFGLTSWADMSEMVREDPFGAEKISHLPQFGPVRLARSIYPALGGPWPRLDGPNTIFRTFATNAHLLAFLCGNLGKRGFVSPMISVNWAPRRMHSWLAWHQTDLWRECADRLGITPMEVARLFRTVGTI